MIGFVLSGRYAGGELNKHPDCNMLFIETQDGERITISKENAVSIEDVTEQYSTNGKKTLMVMWNDFETSIIQFGLRTGSDATPQVTIKKEEIHRTQNKVTQPRKKNLSPKLIVIVGLIISFVIGGIFLAGRHAKQIEEQTRIVEEQERKVLAFKANLHSTIIDTINATINKEYYGDLTNKQILDTVAVTYSNESMGEGIYSGIATYRITLGDRYYFYELSLVGNIDSGTGNASLIRTYDEDSGSDTNYPTQPRFTNKYGTATTQCAYKGCYKYIATSGDTNCCTTHSNKCLNCKCYIDGDATFCMDCMFGN